MGGSFIYQRPSEKAGAFFVPWKTAAPIAEHPSEIIWMEGREEKGDFGDFSGLDILVIFDFVVASTCPCRNLTFRIR